MSNLALEPLTLVFRRNPANWIERDKSIDEGCKDVLLKVLASRRQEIVLTFKLLLTQKIRTRTLENFIIKKILSVDIDNVDLDYSEPCILKRCHNEFKWPAKYTWLSEYRIESSCYGRLKCCILLLCATDSTPWKRSLVHATRFVSVFVSPISVGVNTFNGKCRDGWNILQRQQLSTTSKTII